MPLQVHQFSCLSDNYGYLLRDLATGQVAAIDSPDAPAIQRILKELGWDRLDLVLNTHWHPDHAGGNAALKDQMGCLLLGPSEIQNRYPLDQILTPGQTFDLGETQFSVLDLGGHTQGHIGYYSANDEVAFVGDTLFVLGCGRLFEGTPAQMWASLERIAALPPRTVLYCAHEYTLANAAFALSVDDNAALAERVPILQRLRDQGKPTVPTRVDDELRTNPFLRLPMLETDPSARIQRFADLRAAKDKF
ncbi:MAG: hydroxyacylglutathione hydrolase [Asticcacaulis sp.]